MRRFSFFAAILSSVFGWEDWLLEQPSEFIHPVGSLAEIFDCGDSYQWLDLVLVSVPLVSANIKSAAMRAQC